MKLINFLIRFLPSKLVYAHCDIPCGIYDPYPMQMAAHTVLRMVNLINELKPSVDEPPFDERKKIISQVSRLTKAKEEHASRVEEEIETLWADYFKEEHYKEYPNLLQLINSAVKLTGKVRQEVNMEASQELLGKTQEIAEIFWKTKKIEPVSIPSGYPTEGEIVSHS